MRIEVFNKPGVTDGRATRLLDSVRSHIIGSITDLAIADVYIIGGIDTLSEKDIADIFSDSVSQRVTIDSATNEDIADFRYMIEIAYKPGVTDPVAITSRDAVKSFIDRELPKEALFQTATKYLIRGPRLSSDELSRLAGYFHNPLIQTAGIIDADEWKSGKRFPAKYPHKVIASPASIESFDIGSMDDVALASLSKSRLLALSLDEMHAIRAHFTGKETIAERKAEGLPEKITDVELEMIAQTWSEHCKHKIFNATIRYVENGKARTITSVFKTYIRRATEEVAKHRTFLRSVFHDNSGVVQFDDETLLCFKVETHNSPSALDPYGGAITGIVGVNRDIMGTGRGAKPIWNTNYLCFGFPYTPDSDIPKGILHPRQVMAGVHKGIIDGGNQSGIPVVSGGFLFDESYNGKPLVFCGTGGLLPAKVLGGNAWEKKILAGDLAVMTGGRIGKDGIHGATFSSQALDEESPPSAVQIGDPITQKKMLDFLLEARDKGLFEGITDNGAGGLSSSLGEMATESGGIRIDLDACPLKYQGLAPWEILVSESQERMSIAVHPADIGEFLALAKTRDVEATVVGEFTDDGFVRVFFHDELAGLMSLDFLHEGLPVMELDAVWNDPKTTEAVIPTDKSLSEMFSLILEDPNVASKEELVRQYDHEVQGQSIVKPFVGAKEDAPSDGAVLRPRFDSAKGVTVTHGVCPRYGDSDTYHMAMCALDEAFRAHVALGGNPDEAAALDNFCWPDPIASDANPDGAYKLAQLVRACEGLYDGCVAFSIPLISGKDSMKNDAVIGGKKISVRPTLLVSLIGFVPDVRNAMTTDFKKAGDLVYVAGTTEKELGGSIFERISGVRLGACPEVHPDSALALYKAIFETNREGLIASCHDLSDGGLIVALAESALGARLGATISLDTLPCTSDGMEDARLLFSETPSRFLISVAQDKKERFEKAVKGLPVALIGTVASSDSVIVKHGDKTILSKSLAEIETSWKKSIA